MTQLLCSEEMGYEAAYRENGFCSQKEGTNTLYGAGLRGESIEQADGRKIGGKQGHNEVGMWKSYLVFQRDSFSNWNYAQY